jgi:hypothetical protein
MHVIISQKAIVNRHEGDNICSLIALVAPLCSGDTPLVVASSFFSELPSYLLYLMQAKNDGVCARIEEVRSRINTIPKKEGALIAILYSHPVCLDAEMMMNISGLWLR